MINKHWTYKELELLNQFYGIIPNKFLEIIIGRTKQSIQHKALRLKLTTPYSTDWKYCLDCGTQLSRSASHADKVKRCFPCSMKNHSGSKHHNWKGGKSPLNFIIHTYLKNGWSRDILKRDNYTCQECNVIGGDLEVHHNKEMFHSVRDRVLSKFKDIDLNNFDNKVFIAKEVVKAHKNVSGITLCVRCHSKKHNRKSSELLETPESCNCHNVISNDKRDGLKNIADWTISSQASLEEDEGSTTNANDPERIMKRHERPIQQKFAVMI